MTKLKTTSIVLGLMATMVSGLDSCKKNNFSVDVAPLAAPDAVAFVPQTAVFTYTYFVKNTNNPFIVPVGFTNVSSTDRIVNLTYASNRAVVGTQFTAPTSIVIKGGTSIDSITFKGMFSGYPAGRKDTVKIKFVGISTVYAKDSFQLIISGYCDVIAANLVGDYASSTDTYNGAASTKPNYKANVSAWTPISATSASVIIQNIGATPDNGWGPFGPSDPVTTPGLTATLDWTNPANFSVTIPTQNYFNDGSGMSTITGSGSFSSCDNTLTVTCKVKYAGNGTTYTHVSYLRR